MNGRRVDMEDTILVGNGPDFSIVGVFDGHDDAGEVSKLAAEFVETELGKFLPGGITDERAYKNAFLKIDDMIQQRGISGGSTAVVASITKDTLVVANLGDSRAILVQRRKAGDSSADEDEAAGSDTTFSTIDLSRDHSSGLDSEKERIDRVPGIEITGGRIVRKKKNGDPESIGPSRAFGDFGFKANQELPPEQQAVIAVPDLTIHPRSEEDAFLILACDGIWDVMTSDEVGDFVARKIMDCRDSGVEVTLPRIADRLVEHCFDLGSTDNMSVALVDLCAITEGPTIVRKIDFPSSP